MNPLWAITFALPHEIDGFLKLLSLRATLQYKGFKIFEGNLAGKECLVVQTGMGLERAHRSAQYAFENYPVTHLISTGYCGGLNSKLVTGDAFLATTLRHAQLKETLDGDAQLSDKARQVFQKSKLAFGEGGLVSSPHPILQVSQKEKMAEETRAQAVDMESFSILQAALAARQKIASLTVRFVVDGLKDNLTDTEAFLDAEAKLKPMGLIREVFRRPKILVELPGLERKASLARRRMHQFLKCFFEIES